MKARKGGGVTVKLCHWWSSDLSFRFRRLWFCSLPLGRASGWVQILTLNSLIAALILPKKGRRGDDAVRVALPPTRYLRSRRWLDAVPAGVGILQKEGSITVVQATGRQLWFTAYVLLP
jgi:hypothetical protein